MATEGRDAPPLTPEQDAQLHRYTRLLRDVAIPRGFVGERDADALEDRHVRDSLRAVPHLAPPTASAYDLGSGAGLPGIPVAIALPGLRVTLVEPLQKRAAFLELAVERLGLANARVAIARSEELSGPIDACLARAFASLKRSWAAARPLLVPGGRLIYFAGASLAVPSALPGAGGIQISGPEMLETTGRLVIITAT